MLLLIEYNIQMIKQVQRRTATETTAFIERKYFLHQKDKIKIEFDNNLIVISFIFLK